MKVSFFIRIFAFIATMAAVATTSPTVADAQGMSTSILVDADSGKVLSGNDDRVRMAPASTTKLLTALVAERQIGQNELVPVSARAAAMPAMKIGLVAGQQWPRDQLLYSLLLVSANDAAVALAEKSGGDLVGFARQRAEAAKALGLSDNPVFNDPAGLDDATYGNAGGDLVSARDMAIIARAALASPPIRQIVATPRYNFMGADGVKHTLPNHNRMLGNYEGAIGMKTGYTKKAGNTLVAAATRNGRTMIAVVMNNDKPYVATEALMDKGFSTPPARESPTADVLPVGSLARPVTEKQAVVETKSPGHRNLVLLATISLVVALTLGWRYRESMRAAVASSSVGNSPNA